jgi:sulfur-carrier protein
MPRHCGPATFSRVTRHALRFTARNSDAMPSLVKVASPLRSYTGGQSSVEGRGATVREVLSDLEARYAGMRFRMIDEQGKIRQHIRLFVNTTEVKSLQEPVNDGDTVHLICALSGG